MTESLIVLAAVISLMGLSGADEPPKKVSAIESQWTEILSGLEKNAQQYGDEMTAANSAMSSKDRKLAVERFLNVQNPLLDRICELADEHPKDSLAAAALRQVIVRAAAGPTDHTERALKLLIRDHSDDPDAGKVISRVARFPHWSVSEAYLRNVLDRNPLPENKAEAAFGLGEFHEYKSKLVKRLLADDPLRKEFEDGRGAANVQAMIASASPEKSEAEAVKYFEMASERFGEMTYFGQQTYKQAAQGRIFALRHLSIGKAAPDIDGVDIDGKPFSLSQMRGKVILLTFSGNWCGPCVGMYPHEREIVKRFAGKPFAMVSVNTDKDRDVLRKSLDSGDITWRCWFDGGTDGPITTRWGINAFPAIFVLDSKGVIRYRDERGRHLDQALEKLMAETESP